VNIVRIVRIVRIVPIVPIVPIVLIRRRAGHAARSGNGLGVRECRDL
jgi:hypothetical protein